MRQTDFAGCRYFAGKQAVAVQDPPIVVRLALQRYNLAVRLEDPGVQGWLQTAELAVLVEKHLANLALGFDSSKYQDCVHVQRA